MYLSILQWKKSGLFCFLNASSNSNLNLIPRFTDKPGSLPQFVILMPLQSHPYHCSNLPSSGLQQKESIAWQHHALSGVKKVILRESLGGDGARNVINKKDGVRQDKNSVGRKDVWCHCHHNSIPRG